MYCDRMQQHGGSVLLDAPAGVMTRRPHLKTHAPRGGFKPVGPPRMFARNEEIFGEGEFADYYYEVVSGMVRSCKLLSDGRRHVAAFHLQGEVFGIELADERRFSAEAISEVVVRVFKLSAMFKSAKRDSETAHDLWTLTARQLDQAHDHLLLLAKTAQQRVAAFLLEMSARMPCANAIDLPMSRQDIADYLGLTIETVSRSLAQLEKHAAIERPTSRRVVLRDRVSLACMNA